MFTIIKEIDLYEERLEPAWEYPNPDDQWLFAEEVNEYVGTVYDILYVYDDDTYKEVRGLKQVPESVLQISRNDLSYDDTKRRLKRRGLFHAFTSKTTKNTTTGPTFSQEIALDKAKSHLAASAFSYQKLIKQLEYENSPHDDAVYAVDNCGANWNKQALRQAKFYIDIMAYSCSGLIKQLEYEGFTAEEAKYGADNCGADWNEQAIKKAKDYLDGDGFSYSGLVRLLEYEKFTAEQAKYGVDNSGADWNEQAAKRAESYLECFDYSRQRLIDQLKHEGFTDEQAVYGAESINWKKH